MLNVVDDRLVVEAKGIYSIENYLTSRRLMYWQVYLHKTAVAYENVLVNMLTRAKELTRRGERLFASPSLSYFLCNDVDRTWFGNHPETLQMYEELDDNDVWSSIKVWMHHDDKILSTLAHDMACRRIFKVEVTDEPVNDVHITEIRRRIADSMGIDESEADYMMGINTVQKDMYDPEDETITIIYKDGTAKDISQASELFNIQQLSKKIKKYYLCYQRI